MPTQTIQKPKYKICTENCLAYKHPGDYGCEKGNFVFRPPLRERCTFGLLEGELEKISEQSQPSCTKSLPQGNATYCGALDWLEGCSPGAPSCGL